ncbi:hypothetical protein MPL3356_110214 [Mesorhizobium plurifarium]|uniref:Uncharacterized protein n=1 Tax=Mesorhizobium plurifarium TaxID=69974 RepID=A0A090DEN4_MESPL|nr:hypothetical protein MPL3356_110214 [Mesorhizobium plurifarium]
MTEIYWAKAQRLVTGLRQSVHQGARGNLGSGLPSADAVFLPTPCNSGRHAPTVTAGGCSITFAGIGRWNEQLACDGDMAVRLSASLGKPIAGHGRSDRRHRRRYLANERTSEAGAPDQ